MMLIINNALLGAYNSEEQAKANYFLSVQAT